MAGLAHREVEHQITIEAPATEIYRLIADVENWPRLFPPTVYVEHIERSGDSERIRIWATANGEVKRWVSRRVLDPVERRIEFRQEVSAPPVAEMGGSWLVEEADDTSSLVRLLHYYRAVDDDPEHLNWIEQAVDRNSHSELEALKANIEIAATRGDEVAFSFEDTITFDAEAKDAYDFLNEADRWQERLPHVARVVLEEEAAGLQLLEMDTRTKDGATHTTKSVRVCFPYHKIVYKQITLPALLKLHTGYWLVSTHQDSGNGLSVTSQHSVVIDEANIREVLGPDAGVAEARAFVKSALSANSKATLGHTKEYAEARRRSTTGR